MLKRIVLASVLIVTLVFQMACGPLSKVEDILPYIPSVIDLAVNNGRISAELGAKLKDDVTSGEAAVREAKTCLDANQVPNTTCYLKLANDWRVIIGRNHVAQANDPKITSIFTLLGQIIDLVVRKNTQPVGVRGGTAAIDKQIDAKIKELEREVKGK